MTWPKGEQEVLAVLTARKEYRWRELTDEAKAAFKVAMEAGWNVWKDNDAVEVLSEDEAQRVKG